jgi:GTPase SAR1 family protein
MAKAQELTPIQELRGVVSRIKKGISTVDGEINKTENYTILIGPTGAGKTTLTNVLTGNEIERVQEGGKFVFKVKSPTTKSLYIEHGNKSGTSIPNVCKSLAGLNSYVDCPGFGDTDPKKELENTIFISKVFASSGKQNVLIVAEYASIFSHRAKTFAKLLKDINESLGNNFTKFAKQFSLCISKVSSDDWPDEISDNPPKISQMIQTELKTSIYITGGTMIQGLGNRICCFMKQDSNDSIATKLGTLLNSMEYQRLPMRPVMSPYGEKATNEMINGVFNYIHGSDEKAIQTYIRGIKLDLSMKNTDFSTLQTKLQSYNAVYTKTFKPWHSTIISQQTKMVNLADSLLQFKNVVAPLKLNLSVDGLKSIKFLAPFYHKSDELAKLPALKIASLFELKGLGKIGGLLADLDVMESEWDTLKEYTSPDNMKKALIIGGSALAGTVVVAGTIGICVATGGIALAGAPVIAGVVVGSGLGGTAAGAITSAIAVETSGYCDAYKKDHPKVVPHDTNFRNACDKIPEDLLQLWFASHSFGNSEYLPLLENDLTISGTNSEYDDIFA